MSDSYFDQMPEDEYWCETGFEDGYLGREDASETVPPQFLIDYQEGYEDGAFEYDEEAYWVNIDADDLIYSTYEGDF